MRRAAPLVAAVLAAGAVVSGCGDRRGEVVVFCAASLSRPLSDAAEEFGRRNPDLAVRIAPSGSVVAARKVAELGLRADVVAVADAAVIDRMLVPAHAAWTLELAENEVVLAHQDHSRYTDEITAESWPELLLRPEVRLGCADPATAPLGYHARAAWEQARPGLAAQLAAKCGGERLAPDETELVALLEARAVEYAFLYRSTAEDHHLKITPLATPVRAVYGLTIPASAPNAAGAHRFVAFLLGPDGGAILTRAGFRPVAPARCRGACAALPAELRPLAAVAP